MRNNLFRVFSFICGNLIVIWLFRICFQYIPILCVPFMFSYIVGLIYFPYKKLWRDDNEKEDKITKYY